MIGLDLFSGIGGISCALKEYVHPIAYCELDLYCQGVLLSKMADRELHIAPIWDDIRTLKGSILPEIDIVYGGFPCQNISVAGNGKGLEGERSELFFEMLRLSKEIKPKFIFIENVPAITSRGGLQMVREIAEMGYDCRWCVISAESVMANHKRERFFLLAHSNGESYTRLQSGEEKEYTKPGMSIEHLAWNEWPKDESALLGVDDGLPFRLDRARALGNSVVIRQAKKAFEILMGIK